MYKGEKQVLELLAREKQLMVSQIAEKTGLNEDSVRRIVENLRTSGYATTKSSEVYRAEPTGELLDYCKNEFPEYMVYKKAREKAAVSELSPVEKSIGIRWAKIKGFVGIEKGKLVPRKKEEDVQKVLGRMGKACNDLKESGTTERKVIEEEFFERKLLQKSVERTVIVEYTGKPVELEEGFNVNVPGPDMPVGKNHPITTITKRMKQIMTELGFHEMEGSIIESSFWNFDTLFQPQDHPARELADTFYIDKKSLLPEDKNLVERVKKTHEEGWKYSWDPEEAQKTVLRTHTTSLSARYLARAEDKKPRKYFAIGRVFRNEATDFSHLAEFHQVEGIIAWEKATFTDLLGILREFYRKLGFGKIRFRPSYFPYTEPSLEVEVYFEEKQQWLELGGAGIFRPEVSIPLAGVYPVLAWGLSLERPLMLLLELDDIRTFYKNDLDFLKSSRLEI
ncbi:phenylalanine--tRNA ligase subunit alpha [Candidatus Micrarchaeota archaeon]|nr:phenylalanine--tRNA ligase subunit alpha [Candidatus Micrarchaeota archaeon]